VALIRKMSLVLAKSSVLREVTEVT